MNPDYSPSGDSGKQVSGKAVLSFVLGLLVLPISAIAGSVLGVIKGAFVLVPLLSIVMAIVGGVSAIRGMNDMGKSPNLTGMGYAITGIICSVLGFLPSLIIFVAIVVSSFRAA
jgi:hypothetical protein